MTDPDAQPSEANQQQDSPEEAKASNNSRESGAAPELTTQGGYREQEGAPLPHAAVYKTCSSLNISLQRGLHRQPAEQLAEAVAQVVAVEGPVHVEETIRRVCGLLGVKRSGQRILDAVSRAVYVAEQKTLVRRRGNFLWPAINCAVQVRCRSDDPAPRIDLICEEEIGEAVKLALKRSITPTIDDLILQSSRLLGIRATNSSTATRIRGVILALIQSGELKQSPNGRMRYGE